jgi:lipopolysaccharide export system permease protein
MFKKLDKLILKAFVGPFIATFFITLFVFMMQILWKYIDDLVGKGLDILTLTEFLIYASATLVTLAMPISILISSIMTFGKLGENFELVAIKSSGISLLRFMRPLLFVTILLSGVAFLFANYIAPVANLKFAVIYHDIYEKSPAFDLKDGVFYNGFQGFSIKVDKKDKDRSTLHKVLIYEQTNQVQDNTTISEGGTMSITADKKFLQFKLQNGNRYQENGNFDYKDNEFIDLRFKEYNKLFDLSQLNLQRTSDSLFMNNIRMKTMRQLNVDLDSLKHAPDSFYRKINNNWPHTSGIQNLKTAR